MLRQSFWHTNLWNWHTDIQVVLLDGKSNTVPLVAIFKPQWADHFQSMIPHDCKNTSPKKTQKMRVQFHANFISFISEGSDSNTRTPPPCLPATWPGVLLAAPQALTLPALAVAQFRRKAWRLKRVLIPRLPWCAKMTLNLRKTWCSTKNFVSIVSMAWNSRQLSTSWLRLFEHLTVNLDLW